MNKIYLSQTQIDEMISSLIEQIKRGGKRYSKVIGIRNGGLHVSTKIAEVLNLPHESVKISFYEGRLENDFREQPIEENYDCFSFCPDCLLVDDLIDRGRTLKCFFDEFGVVDTAVLLWAESSIKPTYYVEKKPSEWVMFPWEM